MLSKMTVNDRMKLNGGFLGGPRNPVNRELAMPKAEPTMKDGGPPNLREATEPGKSCGTCVFHDGEAKMCEAHRSPCEDTQVCDDFTPGEDDEAMDSEDD